VSGPRRASDLLRGIVQDLDRGRSRRGLGEALDAVLSPQQREHCQVISFRNGRLLVEVASAPLYAELSGFRREQIRDQINQMLPERKIAELQFRLGGTAHV
jgi:hypothetical protein